LKQKEKSFSNRISCFIYASSRLADIK